MFKKINKNKKTKKLRNSLLNETKKILKEFSLEMLKVFGIIGIFILVFGMIFSIIFGTFGAFCGGGGIFDF